MTHYLVLALYFVAGWCIVSLLFTALIARAGLRISRMQERNRFAWDKPLRYLELDPSEFRRTLH